MDLLDFLHNVGGDVLRCITSSLKPMWMLGICKQLDSFGHAQRSLSISGRTCIGIPCSELFGQHPIPPSVEGGPAYKEFRLITFLQTFPNVTHLEVCLEERHVSGRQILTSAIKYAYPDLQSLTLKDNTRLPRLYPDVTSMSTSDLLVGLQPVLERVRDDNPLLQFEVRFNTRDCIDIFLAVDFGGGRTRIVVESCGAYRPLKSKWEITKKWMLQQQTSANDKSVIIVIGLNGGGCYRAKLMMWMMAALDIALCLPNKSVTMMGDCM